MHALIQVLSWHVLGVWAVPREPKVFLLGVGAGGLRRNGRHCARDGGASRFSMHIYGTCEMRWMSGLLISPHFDCSACYPVHVLAGCRRGRREGAESKRRGILGYLGEFLTYLRWVRSAVVPCPVSRESTRVLAMVF